MKPDLFGISNLTWLAKKSNANLWMGRDSVDPSFFLAVSEFGFCWATWVTAFDAGKIEVLNSRKGKPILKILAKHELEAHSLLDAASSKLRIEKLTLRFFVDLGWRS